MKTMFDKTVRSELIDRINMLNEHCTARWGEMTVSQMVRHNALFEEMLLGKRLYNRVFMGRLFGKVALRSLIKDDEPIKRGLPTAKGFKVTSDTIDLVAERARWVALIEEYDRVADTTFVHVFFGKISREQAGRLSYKHTDHHLRQFGC
jgi:hypothetical protein